MSPTWYGSRHNQTIGPWLGCRSIKKI